MGMDRNAALAYLGEQRYAPLEALTSTTATDTSAGYKGAIDDAALSLGVPFEELSSFELATTSTRGFRASLRYHALRLHANVLRSMLTATEIGDSIKQAASAQLPAVERGMAEAMLEASGEGVVVGVGGGAVARLDTLSLDIYEPPGSEGGVA